MVDSRLNPAKSFRPHNFAIPDLQSVVIDKQFVLANHDLQLQLSDLFVIEFKS